MGTFLTVAGVLLQVVGGLVAFRGLIKTHDAYAEKSIGTLASERADHWRATASGALRRLFGRPRNVVIGVGDSALGFGTSNVNAVVTWGPLPATNGPAIRELDRRTRQLSTRLDEVVARLRDVDEAAKAATESLRADIESAARAADQAVRAAAVEGLMGEAVGLMLVIVGGGLQAWGALIPAA